MNKQDSLIPKHGGFRKLKSFQVAQLAYDMTVRFCDRYIDTFSRTRDQMVQAARSGVQNIAEGSQASGTSKKTELKLTNVARASLEELRLDYEDFLRQRGFPQLSPEHPALLRFKSRRCAVLEDVQSWIRDERKRQRNGLDAQGLSRTSTDTQTGAADGVSRSVTVCGRPCSSLSSAALAANGALSLLNLACYLLNRQIKQQARDFEEDGGFTERLYRVRTANRRLKRNTDR
ncbi:MAG: four helix bundle suffix domain-containing protein [Proteobacteria bacterium]|nr:four helix bundle suffix domain-containing protein [Pseudomonadota bacterium]